MHVFPLAPGRKDQPLVKAWQEAATTDTAQIDAWWTATPNANIGWVPALSGHVIVDLDCKPGKPNGFAALEALQVEHGDILPATRTLTTPSGGEHRIYRGSSVSSVGLVASGIDIRGGIILDGAIESGGYGLLPPSSLTDGPAYRWKSETAASALPLWFAALNTKPMIQPRQAPPEGVELDLPYSIRVARDWLTRQPQAGDGWASDLFYRQATKLQDFGLSNEMCTELLHENNPSYTYEDIGQRVANAERHRQNAIGCDRPISDEEMFASIKAPEPNVKPHKNHFRTRAQSKDEPDPVYLIDGLLQEDSDAALIAPSQHLKVFVALDLAFSVATGTNAALGQVQKKGPVLYFSGEGSRSLKKKRATAWEIARGFEPYSVGDVFIADIVPIVNRPDLIAELIADAKEMLGGRTPALFINDTLNRSLNGEDEDSSATAARYLNTIAGIRRELGGGASLTVHHSGYSDTGRGRGSSGFGAGWDTEINISTHTEDETTRQHEIMVVVTKQKDDDGGQRFYLRSRSVDLPDGSDSLVLDPVPAAERGPTLTRLNENEQRAAIFRVFCERGAHSLDTALKTTELAELLGGVRQPGESANDLATRQKHWYEILRAGTKPPKNKSRGARFADLFEEDNRSELGKPLFGRSVHRWYATAEQCQEFLAAAAIFEEPEIW